VNEYVDAVRCLACRVLDLLGEGLGLEDPTSFSRLISAVDSDSLIRINHYPTSDGSAKGSTAAVGFGEHTDPQILSVLRANDVDGLQVLRRGGGGDDDDRWVQVPADPSAFFINVGDVLQVSASCLAAHYFEDKLAHVTV
jgi:gibberellin 2beta-dioxygenase